METVLVMMLAGVGAVETVAAMMAAAAAAVGNCGDGVVAAVVSTIVQSRGRPQCACGGGKSQCTRTTRNFRPTLPSVRSVRSARLAVEEASEKQCVRVCVWRCRKLGTVALRWEEG